MPQRTCAVGGCTRPVRARGLCSTDYNRQHQPNRHTKSTVPCSWCGKPTQKHVAQRHGARFCSLACRDTWPRRDKLPVLFAGQVVRPRPASSPPVSPRRWTAGRCKHCRTPFVDRQPDARFCSVRCGRRWWRAQYKDDVPHAVRLYVLERDGWRCHLCSRGIPATLSVPHPKAGTVDHVVPRSQGGDHDPANLRAAHMGCNSARNNRGGNEQLALIG